MENTPKLPGVVVFKTTLKEKKRFFTITTFISAVVITGVIAYFVSGPPKMPGHGAAVSRGQAGDLVADMVLGKPDFSEITPNTVVPNRLNKPRSVIVDRSQTPNKLYVYDLNNSRILGIDLSKCLSASTNPKHCSPDLIFGQPNGNTSACNGDSGFQNYPTRAPASAATLCGLPDLQLNTAEGGSSSSMALDSQGNLYVTDFWNNRVLKYNSPFSADKTGGKGDTVADDVWGQSGFTGVNCNNTATAFWQYVNPTASSLCFSPNIPTGADVQMSGVDVDQTGNIWVADPDNNRVLRFPAGSHTADLVLGQTGFTSNSSGSGLNQLNRPTLVRVANNGIYVGDHNNRRILFYPNPVSTNMSGSVFLDNSGGLLPDGANGLDLDPQGRGLWIGYHTCSGGFTKYDLWSFSAPRTIVQSLSGSLCETMGSIGIDSQGDYFAGVETGDFGHDVVMWPAGGPYNQTTISLFAGGTNVPFGARNFANQKDASGLSGPSGVAVYENGTTSQLIALDANQIKYWNNLGSLTTHKPTDGMAEVTDFSSRLNGLNGPIAIIKASRNTLYATTTGNDSTAGKPGIMVYSLPLTSAEHYNKFISLPLPVLGGGQLSYPAVAPGRDPGIIWGLAPTADDKYLWVTDTADSRIFRIRDPLTNPVVDIVLGQPDVSSVLCNRVGDQGPNQNMINAQPNTLCRPGALSFDKLGNLWVADTSVELDGNMRLMEFNASNIPAGNTTAIFAPSANKIFPNFQTWEPAFDSQNHMVVGQGTYWNADPNRFFPTVFYNPLSASTTPDAYFNEYSSFAFSMAFDSNDNMYVADASRGRILIYRQPLGSPKPGDLNKDGTVNAQDLSLLLSNYGTTNAAGDVNKDGTVNALDLSILLSHYGT